MSIDPITLAGYGGQPGDIYDLSKKWAISPKRLTFLMNCPSGIHRKFLSNLPQDLPAADRAIATACRLAYRQGFTEHEAAEMAKVQLAKVQAFLASQNVTWPPGCRRKLAWGGSTTLYARKARGNLLAGSKPVPERPTSKPIDGKRLSSEEVVMIAMRDGLTLKQAEADYGIPYQTLYHATRRLKVKVTKQYKPRSEQKGKVRL